MFIYNLIYALSILGILLTYKSGDKKTQNNNILYILLSSIMVLTVCLHGENVGPDTHTYMYLYLHPNEAEFSRTEILLPFIVSILRTIYANPYFINFCVLLVSQIPIFILIGKYSNNRFYSIFLYLSYTPGISLFLISIPAVRQTLAMGFFALAVHEYLKNNCKISKSVIACLTLMLLTHISSMLALPLFFITNINISKKRYYIGSIIACMVGVFISYFMGFLKIFAIALDKEFYITAEADESTILTVVPFIVPFWFMVYYLPVEKLQTIWIKGMFCLVIVVGMLFPIAFNLDRIVAYYCLMSIFAIPELSLIKHFTFKNLTLNILNIIILLYFSYKYYKVFEILADSEYPFVPYETFL